MALERRRSCVLPSGNTLREGDVVRVRDHPGRRGFVARFKFADYDGDELVQVTVLGGVGYDPRRPMSDQSGIIQWRTFTPDRISTASGRRKR